MACEIIFGSPVHTVAEKVLSQKSEDCRRKRRQSHFCATVWQALRISQNVCVKWSVNGTKSFIDVVTGDASYISSSWGVGDTNHKSTGHVQTCHVPLFSVLELPNLQRFNNVGLLVLSNVVVDVGLQYTSHHVKSLHVGGS